MEHNIKDNPTQIRLKHTVMSDFPDERTFAKAGVYYSPWLQINPHGAVSVRATNGEWLGIKPDEFEVLETFEQLMMRLCDNEESGLLVSRLSFAVDRGELPLEKALLIFGYPEYIFNEFAAKVASVFASAFDFTWQQFAAEQN